MKFIYSILFSVLLLVSCDSAEGKKQDYLNSIPEEYVGIFREGLNRFAPQWELDMMANVVTINESEIVIYDRFELTYIEYPISKVLAKEKGILVESILNDGENSYTFNLWLAKSGNKLLLNRLGPYDNMPDSFNEEDFVYYIPIDEAEMNDLLGIGEPIPSKIDENTYYCKAIRGRLRFFHGSEWEEWSEFWEVDHYFAYNDEYVMLFFANGIDEYKIVKQFDMEEFEQDGIKMKVYSMDAQMEGEPSARISILITDNEELNHAMTIQKFEGAHGTNNWSDFEFVDFEDLPKEFQDFLVN